MAISAIWINKKSGDKVLSYLKKKYNIDPANKVFISDNKFNIPAKTLIKLNKRIIYTSDKIDSILADDTHAYIQRIYNGTIHDSDTEVKFMKELNVKVDAVEDIYDAEIFTARFYLSNKVDNIKYLNHKISEIIDKFLYGEIGHINMASIKTYNDVVSIQYQIGPIQIYSNVIPNIKATEYIVGLPYEASCKMT